jgi:hypothetical protein
VRRFPRYRRWEVTTVNATIPTKPEGDQLGGSVIYESVLQSFTTCHRDLFSEKSKDEPTKKASSRNGYIQVVSTGALTHVQRAWSRPSQSMA